MAEVKHEAPVGTLEELKKHRLGLGSYGSCSKPESRSGNRINIGCPFAVDGEDGQPLCQFRPGTGVPAPWDKVFGKGPENVPVRTFFDGGKVMERQLECYEYMQLHFNFNEVQDSGAHIEVIPGKKYTWRGTKAENRTDDGKMKTYHVDDVHEEEVKPFLRPGSNPRLAADSYAAMAMKRAAAERRERASVKRIGQVDDDEADVQS